jgi:hypothetical protein
VVAVSTDPDPESAAQLPESTGADFPILWEGASAIADAYKVELLPHTVVIDRSGRIAAVIETYERGPLEAAVQRSLDNQG